MIRATPCTIVQVICSLWVAPNVDGTVLDFAAPMLIIGCQSPILLRR